MGTEVENLPWFALQVRARQERGVARFLEANGFTLFLPVYTSRKHWSDRIKTIQSPLFPGYVFCRFDPHNRLPILKAPGVIQIVGPNRLPARIEDSEIEAIQALVVSKLPYQPWPFVSVGDRVRIEAGPLQGHEGLLVAFKGHHRVMLSVSLLQRSVAVDIDLACVTPLRGPLESGAHVNHPGLATCEVRA